LRTPQSHRVPHGPLREYRNGPAAAPPPLDAPDMHPPTCRALGAVPTDPTLLGRTRKRRWQEEATHSDVSVVSAESELGTLPVSVVLLRALQERTRPLGRCYAAPTATMCPYGTRAPYPTGRGGPMSTP
jgi:hypothetical protein